MNQEQYNTFKTIIEEEWNTYRKKLKQFCFLHKLDFSDDVLNETYLKVSEKILKDGIKAETKQEHLDYFFLAFRNNTYLAHKKNINEKVDDNLQIEDLNLVQDEPYNEDTLNFMTFSRNYLESIVKENFDEVSYGIWRIRYLITINGRELNYKQVKEITGVTDTRARIIKINQFLRENVKKEDIVKEYNNFLKEFKEKSC